MAKKSAVSEIEVVADYKPIAKPSKKVTKTHYLIDYSHYCVPMSYAYAGQKVGQIFAEYLGEEPKYPSSRYLLTESQIEMAELSMVDNAKSTTVLIGENGDGKVSIPVFDKFAMFSDSYSDTTIWSDWLNFRSAEGSAISKILKAVESMFGKDIWDIDKTSRYSFEVDPKLFLRDDEDFNWQAIDSEYDDVKPFLKAVKKMHIIARPADGSRHNQKIRSLKQFRQETKSDSSRTEEDIKLNFLMKRKFQLFIDIDLPAEYIKYVTQSEIPDVTDLHKFMSIAVADVGRGDSSAEKFNPIRNVRDRNVGEKIKPNMVNEDGLAFQNTGEPIYIPVVDRITKIDELYRKLGKMDDMGWSLDHPMDRYYPPDDMPSNQVKSRLIYTDMILGKIAFSGTTHPIQIKDISTCVAARDRHIYSLFVRQLIDDSVEGILKDFNYYVMRSTVLDNVAKYISLTDFDALIDRSNGNTITNFGGISFEGSAAGETEVNKNFKKRLAEYIQANGLLTFINTATNTISLINKYHNRRASLKDDYDVDKKDIWAWSEVSKIRLSDITPDSDIKFLRVAGHILRAVAKEIAENPMDYVEGRAIENGLKSVGFALCVDKHLADFTNLEERVQKQRKKLKNNFIAKQDWKAPATPNIVPGFKLLPHQGKVMQRTQDRPEYVTLPVEPGGGKTLISLLSAVQMIDEGVVKRPLIICPANLVENYFVDIQKLTAGKMNLVALTSSTVAAHGFERLAQIVLDAPPNTIFITDYYFNKSKAQLFPYGDQDISISISNKFLIDLEFDVVFVDESQFCKNENTDITTYTNALVSSIPRVYVMSGTLVDGSLVDLVAQTRLQDPTIFGTTKNFLDKYADDYSGTRVVSWEPGAQQQIHQLLLQNVCYVPVKRREWAAILPKLKAELFHDVYLSAAQMSIYKDMLKEVMEEIKKNSAIMARIKKAEMDEEEGMINLESALNPYLAKLEQFLTNPTHFEIGDKLLTGKDRISPKVQKVVEIIENHINGKVKGKIIIFCKYHASVQAIMDNLPSSLKQKFLHYKASDKAKHKSMFLNDKNIIGMIGVSTSLTKGHNFQNASRIIRVEGEWNPGEDRQGRDRILRPDVEDVYGIKDKFLDWVLASGTIDITKMGRLISKMLVKTAWDEADNINFRGLPQLNLVSMTLDSIASKNDFNSNLKPYIDAYHQMQALQDKDEQSFLADSLSLKKPFPVPQAKDMKGSAFIAEMPYIENHTLPYADELGLSSVIEYAVEQGLLDPSELKMEALWVHTEFGDGKVLRTTGSTVHVLINSEKIICGRLKVFIFRDQVEAKSKIKKNPNFVKERLTKMLGMPVQILKEDTRRTRANLSRSIVDHIVEYEYGGEDDANETMIEEVPIKEQKIKSEPKVKDNVEKKDKPKKPVPNTDLTKNGKIGLFAYAINGQFVVALDDNDPDVEPTVMDELGFTLLPKHWYCYIKSKKQFDNLSNFIDDAIAEKQMVLPEAMAKQFVYIKKQMAKGMQMATVVEKINAKTWLDYRLAEKRMDPEKKAVHLFFLVEDGDLYAILHTENAPHGRKFKNQTISGIKWNKEDGYYVNTFKTAEEAKAFGKQLKKQNYIDDETFNSFKEELKSLKVSSKITN